jgi:hypothetical protein
MKRKNAVNAEKPMKRSKICAATAEEPAYKVHKHFSENQR